jgi:aminopeptidase N
MVVWREEFIEADSLIHYTHYMILRILPDILITILVYFVLALPGAAIPSDTPDQNEYDVLHYTLHISLNMEKKEFSGNVDMRFNAVKKYDRLYLFASNKSLVIDSIKYHSKKLTFFHVHDSLQILSSPASSFDGDENITVYYRGKSFFNGDFDDGGLYFSSPEKVASSSQPNFARRWWPCKDTPSDKATATIAITVPRGMTAVSNGLLKDVAGDDTTATYTWETKYPIATYLISIVAAPYYHFSEFYTSLGGDPMPVLYYVFQEDSDKAKVDLQNTRVILEYFARTFSEYPFLNEKYGVAEVDGDLTMENQTICSFQKSMFTGDRQFELTLAHETAHHWFGNMVTPLNWRHTWLNEGFATYAEVLYLEHRKGRGAYQQYINNMMNMPDGFYAGSIVGKSDTAFWDSFATRVYYKGALVLHMLRGMMGDSAFFLCLRNYLNNPRLRYANAETNDFIRECESVYGKDLGLFFRQWIFSGEDSLDRPHLEYVWGITPRGWSYIVDITIEQKTAPAMLYRLPFAITLASSSGDHVFNVVDSLAIQKFSFEVSDKPDSVIIDKDRSQFLEIHRR